MAGTLDERRWLAAVCVGLLLAAAPGRADPARRRDAVVEVVERVGPAVVYIGTEQRVERRWRGGGPLSDFFGVPPERDTVEGLGSGVIVDSSGLIVTNDHVIRGASAIHVVLADGRQLDADVIGSDADNDLAVLRVQSRSALPTARLGTSSDLMIGERVIAIGSPFGLDKTVTTGVVSAKGRSFKAGDRIYNDFIQTDAAINPGNSGGPLLNVDGDVIGINTAIYANGQGIGFAIPADKVRRIVAELTEFGKVRPAWVGVNVAALSRRTAARLGWDRKHGVMVADIEPGSPAEKAGLKRGDLVAEVGGTRVDSAEDFDTRIRGYTARASFPVTLFRDGAMRTVTVSPVEFPRSLADALAWDRLGVRVRAVDGALVISSVRRGSPSDQVGLEAGDGLLRINGQRMRDVETFREALVAARTKRSVLLLVQRGRAGYHLTLPF